MSVDKKVKYDVQGGVKNYLGKQKEVKAPLKWQSSPDHPKTELAYITKKEKDLLVKKDLHGSLKGSVNRGPSGIISLNGYGSIDSSGRDVGMSGAATSDAEAGRNTANTRAESPSRNLPPGVRDKALQGYRDAFINAGGGQKVNAGFFGGKYNDTVSARDIAFAKAARNNPNNRFAKGAYKNTRGSNFGGLGSLLMGALGMFTGIPGLGLITGGLDKFKGGLNSLNRKFRGVNPDGTTRTQAQYEQSMYDKRQQNRVTKLLEAKNRGYNQIGFGDFTKKTVDFTPNQQALLNDLIAQGYGPSSLNNPNPTFETGNPDMNLNDVQSIVAASQVPQGTNTYTGGSIPFNPGMTVGYGTGIETINPNVTDSYNSASDLPAEFQDMAIQAGNYSQNEVGKQLYGKEYDVLNPFEQEQINKAIETIGTKSTGQLASGTSSDI